MAKEKTYHTSTGFHKGKLPVLVLAFLLLFLLYGKTRAEVSITRANRPKNVILFIGDGMGPEQVKAAGIYYYGKAGTLSFESFTYTTSITTQNASGTTTDSAASATAMATGVKVDNGVISLRIPGDGSPLTTLLEMAKGAGMSTGLVTTTYISHATPAAFGAHEESRYNNREIVLDYLTGSHPNVLFGGARFLSRDDAERAGYRVVTDSSDLMGMDTEAESFVSGQFGRNNMPYEFGRRGALPHLSEMTETALSILDNDPDGFFLMVEGGRIDHACHKNDIARAIFETMEFSRAVESALSWAGKRNDTLIVVTADHETGGLKVTRNNGPGHIPTITWSTFGHTGTSVTVYGTGPGAEGVPDLKENSDIFTLIAGGN